jgi:hypothetical protein
LQCRQETLWLLAGANYPNLLKQEQSLNRGIKGKRLKAAWDHPYLLKRMAAHLSATAGARRSPYQAAGATDDAEARHAGPRQAALPRHYDRRPSQPADWVEASES